MKISNNPNAIDIDEWSNFVYSHPDGNIFQTPEMYDVFSRTKNYDPVISFSKNTNLTGILIGVIQREYNFFKSLTSRAIVWGGPLCHNKDELLAKKILEHYFDKTKGKILYTQIRNLHDTDSIRSAFTSLDFKFDKHLNYILDLNKSEDQILSEMNKKRRNTIKKSLTFSLTVNEVKDLSGVKSSYKILHSVYKRARLPLADYSYFQNAFQILKDKGMVTCFNAIYNNQCIGTLWTLNYKDRIYDWYSGSLSNHLDKYPNDFLLWYAIRWSLENKYEIFDFGGAGKPGQKYGVREYKKKFGGLEVQFGRYEKTHMPIRRNLIFSLYNLYKSFKS
tara:strand:+ start:3027 stop:4028 length:1002 start_codon:yes stop_codon:yes gene_type:complete